MRLDAAELVLPDRAAVVQLLLRADRASQVEDAAGQQGSVLVVDLGRGPPLGSWWRIAAPAGRSEHIGAAEANALAPDLGADVGSPHGGHPG